jgi:murein DD-endopeptidase MepM/ murein hydrolase activator NlpD
MALRARLGRLLARRGVRPPSVGAFLGAANFAFVLALVLGFSDDVGRALRRRGDWLVEDRDGAIAHLYRRALASAVDRLERLDAPPELAPILLPPDRPGPPGATSIEWVHPLAGPRRAMPGSESRRFGAARPPPRPLECELGHCGVDLGGMVGEPVFAAFDGVVERIERDEARGGRAGCYVRIGHKDGAVVTRYLHLDTIRADLVPGQHVAAGERIARLGATGIVRSAPHLHFGLSIRQGGPGGTERYIDPEPLLRRWRLPEPSTAVALAR